MGQLLPPFAPQFRNAPGTPAPISSTAAAGTTPTAPPIPSPTGPSAGEQGRAAGTPEVLRAIEGLWSNIEANSRSQNENIAGFRSDLDKFALRLAEIERSRINGSARGNSDAHTGTFAPSGFSFAKLLVALNLERDGRGAEARKIAKREFEMMEAAEQNYPHMRNLMATPGGGAVERVMVTSSNSAGGYLLPPEFSTELITLARDRMILNVLGARYLTGLAGSPLTLPVQSGAGTAYWLATQGVTAITPSDLTFDQVSASFKMLAMLMIVSRVAIDLTNPAIEQLIREDMANVMALEWQSKAFKGTTGGAHPVGIIETSGINAPAGAGINTIANLNSYSEKTEVENLPNNKQGIAMNLKVRNSIQRTGNLGDYGYLMSPIGNDQVLSQFLGYPCVTTNALVGTSGSAEVIYSSNWQELMLCQWGGLTVELSDHYQFNLHNRALKTFALLDVMLRRKKAFTASKTVTYT